MYSSMEGDLLFSFPSASFLDYSHAADYLPPNGSFFDLGLFSGNVLDTVSEDPMAELEDSIAGLDADTSLFSSAGISLAASADPSSPITDNLDSSSTVPDERSGEPMVLPLSPMQAESPHLLSSPRSLSSFNRFDDSSLTLKQLQSSEVNLIACCEDADAEMEEQKAGGVTVLAKTKSEEILLQNVKPPTPEHVEGFAEGLIRHFNDGLLAPSRNRSAALAAEPIYTTPSGIDPSSTSFFSIRKSNLAHQQQDALYAQDADDVDSTFQNGMLTFAGLQSNFAHKLDLPLPQARMQRSLSSHALGQLGKRNFPYGPECHEEGTHQPYNQSVSGLGAPWITQTAPLCSSSKVVGLAPGRPQVHLANLDQTGSSVPVSSMRRVYSTGDLQTLNGMQFVPESTSPHSTSSEERGARIGRYTLEERKSRICRYRQKRTERNFSKKIKYACRKTLADSRPRVRGRFARNDDSDDIPFHSDGLHNHEDEDEEVCWQPRTYTSHWLRG